MENPEEILHILEQFSKFRPKEIPRELEEYLCFVAKTGDPVYQWATIKHLLREKLINVVTEFYESCSLVDIQPCKNVEKFDYDIMKSFILEKLDTFVSAPFTVQRLCELLTTPRKEYNRIDKFMRALEKNVLVVSTVEPGMKNAENGDGLVNGLESDHVPDSRNCSTEIIVVEMEETNWQKQEEAEPMQFQEEEDPAASEVQDTAMTDAEESVKDTEMDTACSSSQDTNATTIEQKITENEKVEPMNPFVEECSESIASEDVNIDQLPTTEAGSVFDTEPVASSDVSSEVVDTEVVSSEELKTNEATQEDDLKQADSTTSLKSPQTSEVPTDCQLESSVVETEEPISNQQGQNAIESSENDNTNTDSDSNQSSVSTEPDTINEAQLSVDGYNEVRDIISNESEESIIYHEGLNSAQADTTEEPIPFELEQNAIESSENDNTNLYSDSNQSSVSTEPDTVNEAQLSVNGYNEVRDIISNESEESIIYHEGLNSAQADTTRGYEKSENTFQNKIEESKDEEISSSDKVVVAVPNTSVAYISDDEAEAEVQKVDVPEETKENPQLVKQTTENESQVTASTDEITKDSEVSLTESDSKDRGDFNEAEATPESI